MKKQLYYTVERGSYDDGSPNGLKTINVYEEGMVLFAELECSSDDLGEFLYTNEEEIQNYLDDNGYGDEDYEFSRL